jgi:hypothetical protein
VSLIGGGSAGAFDPWASDVDVVVVIERPLPPDPLLELAAELRTGAGRSRRGVWS